MHFSKIIGVGSYLPLRVMLNSELVSMVDTSDEWIQARTGIKQRHIARDDESACDMAARATEMALASAKVNIDEIDLIIVATYNLMNLWSNFRKNLQNLFQDKDQD